MTKQKHSAASYEPTTDKAVRALVWCDASFLLRHVSPSPPSPLGRLMANLLSRAHISAGILACARAPRRLSLSLARCLGSFLCACRPHPYPVAALFVRFFSSAFLLIVCAVGLRFSDSLLGWCLGGLHVFLRSVKLPPPVSRDATGRSQANSMIELRLQCHCFSSYSYQG
jgi:hypothetical protein